MRSWYSASAIAASATSRLALVVAGLALSSAAGAGGQSAPAAGTSATSAPDFAQLAGQYEQARRAGPPLDGPVARIFISFTLPPATLERLADQASRSGAILVLRGLDGGSLPQTMRRVAGMLGKKKATVQIDPAAFRRYGIAVVPAFVLSAAGGDSQCAKPACTAPGSFAKVAGDVSLDFALDRLASGAPVHKQHALALSSRLDPERTP